MRRPCLGSVMMLIGCSSQDVPMLHYSNVLN